MPRAAARRPRQFRAGGQAGPWPPEPVPYTEWAAMVCVAEEALNLVDTMTGTRGNRIFGRGRAAELRASLAALANPRV